MKRDVVIVGAGPAGIFTAIEMLKRGSRRRILIVEKGEAIEKRRCPKHQTKRCVSCKPYCHITTGFSGAGAFSDGKLSLSYEVGGDLPSLIGAEKAQEAIHYAEANGAVICNLSFGSTQYDESVAQAIQNSKMLFIVAAGNGDSYGNGYDIDANPVYPASLPYDNIITVGNILFDGNLDESSNWGVQNVDLAAPGVYILSTVTGGGYGYMSGTSMAAPMVTGAAALVYSSHPQLDVLGVKQVLLNSVRKTEQLAGKVLTGGMLDVGAAMAYGQTPQS